MLLPPNPAGSSFTLGTHDPNTMDPNFFDLEGGKARKQTENGITYWTTASRKLNYRSGQPPGRTARLNIQASGGVQTYTWKNGALEHGFIGNKKDLKNLEATVYVRVRGYNDTHASMTWKIRGGEHASLEEGDEHRAQLASCTGMSVPYMAGTPEVEEDDAPRRDTQPTAYREYNHPNYDDMALTPKFPYLLQEGQWLGVKIISYLVDGGTATMNRLYLDTDPFDASGKPRNQFRLYTEWIDKDGVSTGRYTQAATWGGWRTTFRVDGWQQVDFTLLSAREIIPPAAGQAL